MIQLGEQEVHSPSRPAKGSVSLHEQWVVQYGPVVADQLRPGTRYSLIRIGSAEFAYTGFDRYVRALAQAWEGGFVADPLPTTAAEGLVELAPDLRGVDLDLADLDESDVAPPRRRFSRAAAGRTPRH